MKELKLVSTILLSIILVLFISTTVFADDTLGTDDMGDIWSDVNVIENSNTGLDENLGTEENESFFEDVNNIENENTGYTEENEENNEYNNLYESNSTTSNSENLAETGLEDHGGIVAFIVVVCGIVAVYSAKRMNDYNNI